VQLPDGTTAYTRDGSFKKNQDGTLMTADGYPLTPTITIPTDAEQITVGSDGTVSARTPGNPAPQNLGRIELARFVNPSALDARLGRNLLVETVASGPPIAGNPGLEGIGTLEQGYLENSNVQVVEEILQMIIAQRAYEANSKVIQSSDEMLQLANNVKR
jgi:flagellar basal-body rod protein FlgG